MPVGELLQRTDSRELTEWAAYEREYGALGPTYERELMREMHYQQQLFLYHWGASKVAEGKQPPFPEPKRIPGPTEFIVDKDDVEDEEEE